MQSNQQPAPLFFARSDIERLLPVAECIDVMADAFAALAGGGAAQPLRGVLHLPDGSGSLYTMPGWLGDPPALAVKMVGVFHGNRERGLDTHQGVVALFDAQTGEPRAIMDAAAVTAIRTAAVSGLATRLLAREDAGDLALLGSGVQARTHLEAMAAVRPLRRVRVWSPTPERRDAFVSDAALRTSIPVEAVGSAEAAVRGADLICTVTAAQSPVLRNEWVQAGAHINAVGASTPTARELDGALVARAWLCVDRRESALAEAGDFLMARAEGVIGDDHIRADLGDLVTGRVPARGSPAQVTVFKSLGLAIEDVAAARYILERALGTRGGTGAPMGNPARIATP
jgi:ornithine cyclodeaminase